MLFVGKALEDIPQHQKLSLLLSISGHGDHPSFPKRPTYFSVKHASNRLDQNLEIQTKAETVKIL